jgi:arylsulfatase A-like enzyme/Flp pilus assembly protein TadD
MKSTPTGHGLALIALAVLTILEPACTRRPRSYAGAPVILISVDTLRADHLPLFGYRDGSTPAIDALRADGILFTAATSHVPLTLPSHVTALTGLLPPQNGVRNNIGYRLGDAVPTLASVLHASGYATGGAVSAYVLRAGTGIARSFDYYDDAIESRPGEAVGSLQRAGSQTAQLAERWIERSGGDRFFFFLHLFEPHSPYTPPEPFLSRFKSPYDGEIATADSIVGEFVSFLKRRGLYDRAIIILMSDHGEGLYDHGEPEHGIFLYRETLHVPLIIKLPRGDRRGETVRSPVGLVDILPTVAQLTGVEPPARLDGRSLLDAPSDDARSIYSETLYPRIHLGWSELRSLTALRYHFIEAPRPELYDMEKDPAEKQNVLSAERRTYAGMKEALGKYGSDITMPAHVDSEEAAKLAALGYLGSVHAPSAGPLPDPKDRIGELSDMMAAFRLLREGQTDKGIASLEAILAKNPRLTDAWNELAITFDQTGRYEEAVGAYRKAIEFSPESAPDFGLALGGVLLKMNKLDDAAAHARLGEKVNPGGAHLLLARIELGRKNLPAAEKLARSAEVDNSVHAAAAVVLAQILVQQNRLPEAMATIEGVASELRQKGLGPVESLNFVRGDVLGRMNRLDEAAAAFRREIAAFPHNRQPYANLALVLALQGHTDEARTVLSDLARTNPDRATYLFIGRTLGELNDAAGAAEWRRRAAAVR